MSFVFRFLQGLQAFSDDSHLVYHGWTDRRCAGGSFSYGSLTEMSLEEAGNTLALLAWEWGMGIEHLCVWFVTWYDVLVFAMVLSTIMMALCLSFVGALNFVKWWCVPMSNTMITWWIVLCKTWFSTKVADSAPYRMGFLQTPAVVAKVHTNHSHPDAAKTRNASTYIMDYYCRLIGRKPYYVQASRTDERKGRPGSRHYFWGKDLNIGAKAFRPSPKDVVCLVDVDMYMDMPLLLAMRPQLYLISTFTPSKVAHCSGDYSFTFHGDDEVEYLVSGGARFRHQIWNYSNDVLVAHVSYLFGAVHYYTVYNVERRKMDEHHSLICLIPSVSICSPIVDLSKHLGGAVLERLRIAHGEFLALDVITKSGIVRSVGRVGRFATTELPVDKHDIISMQAKISKVDITPASIRSLLKINDAEAATVLTDYHRGNSASPVASVCAVEESVFRYQFGNYEPDAKPSLIAFMSPLVQGAYSPDQTVGNEAKAIRERIINVRPTNVAPIDAYLSNIMEEFVGFMVPVDLVGSLHPCDIEEVYARQNRPAQRAILSRAELGVGDVQNDVVETFLKKEAYSGPKDPRIITTIPGDTKLPYSTFVYSFSQHIMRQTEWYAFGRTPRSIAEKVAALCTDANHVVLSDFSRMDGRIHQILRDLERMVMLAAFDVQHHPWLLELMSRQMNRKAVTPLGLKYDSMSARLSGSPETADFNSMDNAFVNYLALRMCGLEPRLAWSGLGIYGGDDGLTANVDPVKLTEACQRVGQVLDVAVIKNGELGVNFLARYFGPDVWHGCPDSICDLPRQLSKFHTTVALSGGITPFMKLSAKCLSYYLTDQFTPIIGNICVRFLASEYKAMNEKEIRSLLSDELVRGAGNWWMQYDLTVQWPNDEHDWCLDYVNMWLPNFDITQFFDWLDSCDNDRMKFLSPPVCMEWPGHPTVKEEVVINGEVVLPERAELPKKKVCFDFQKGKCDRKVCKFQH
jgi:hypothetical protein